MNTPTNIVVIARRKRALVAAWVDWQKREPPKLGADPEFILDINRYITFYYSLILKLNIIFGLSSLFHPVFESSTKRTP
jgi:hypothetical protein